jgi:hypothetical protein
VSARFGDPDWFSAGNLAARASAAVDAEDQVWAAYAGVMANILGSAGTEPGPPHVHTLVPPEPIGWDEDDNPVYPEPGPAYTLTERTVITADFCQCPDCRAERCEP